MTWLFTELAEADDAKPIAAATSLETARRMTLVDCDRPDARPGECVRAIYRCSECDLETDWIERRNFSEARLGPPCARCNPERS